jgi:NAD(P)-dependent dehydrogenase (short-subunit alcohol dehydrogenase family)
LYILDNGFGLFLGYRAAKSALNQVSVTLAREWEKEGRKTTIVCVEPGFLSTRLTNFDGEDDMETCIAGLMKVFDGITPKDNGAFLKWDGTTISF